MYLWNDANDTKVIVVYVLEMKMIKTNPPR